MKRVNAAAMALALASGSLQAQTPYPGCRDMQPADFKATELFNKGTAPALGQDPTLNEPTGFVTHGVKKPDGSLDHVDVYFVERGGTGSGKGAVKHFDGATHKVNVMGTIDVWGKVDAGLMGVTLHPDFDHNHYLYVWYVILPAGTANRHMRLDRISVDVPTFTLDMTSRKNILDVPGSTSDRYHTGGPMAWDAYGDLWIQIGNNSVDVSPLYEYLKPDSATSAEWGPSNTASLRGGTIRIHPDESAKGYSIPAGNFGEYWAKYWDSTGHPGLAAQYRDPKKVLPEIYIKGERSNYSIAVHPVKRWLAWGTVNYESHWDEFNIVGHPAFTGFPYYHSKNDTTTLDVLKLYPNMTPAMPVNYSTLKTGVDTLPPAVPSEEKTIINTAIGGPIYLFDPALKSDIKFPPQMHNSWIGFGWKDSRMALFTLDTVNIHVTRQVEVGGAGNLFSVVPLRNPLAAQYGPDGALYLLNYGTPTAYSNGNSGVVRVDYVGPCTVPVATASAPALDVQFSIDLTPARLSVREPGEHEFSLYDTRGRRVFVLRGAPGAEYAFDRLRAEYHLRPGVYSVCVRTGRGNFLRNVSFL